MCLTEFHQIYGRGRSFWVQPGPGPVHLNVWVPTESEANLQLIVLFKWNVAMVT